MSTSGGDRAGFFASMRAIPKRLAVGLEHDRAVAVGAKRGGARGRVTLDDLLGVRGASRTDREDCETRCDRADEFLAVRARAAVARRLKHRARDRDAVRDEPFLILGVEVTGKEHVEAAVA